MRLFSNKKDVLHSKLHTFIFLLVLFGFSFGTYYYKGANTYVIDIFDKLIYSSSEEYISYQLWYISISFLYFLFSFLFGTSYVGVICNAFIIFSKGIQFSFSLCKVFSTSISFELFILGILPQLVLELFILYIVSLITLRLSIQTFYVAFINHETFRLTRIMNYILDYTIILLLLFVGTILFRVYLL